MALTNYHSHCYLCDGKGRPEDYALRAVQSGFQAYGFSSHAPLAFVNEWTMKPENMPVYIEETERVKKNYKNKIEIYRGLEIDFIPGIMGPSDTYYDALGLDYKIGSVHVVPGRDGKSQYSVDGTDAEFNFLLSEHFGNSIKAMAEDYFERVRLMLDQGGFHITGHLDLIKKKNRGNRYFSESENWYIKAVEQTLDSLVRFGGFMEVNTGGIARGYTDTVYPSPWILEKALIKKIPIILNSDSHRPEDMGYYYTEALGIIKNAGYSTRWVLLGSAWKEIPL